MLLLVALNYYHYKKKSIANKRDSVSLKLKLAVLGQNWEETSYLRHQHISSPLDGIDAAKAVDKTKIASYNFFNASGFDCDQGLGEPQKGYGS